ncbi:hypothetical protein BCR36DRAFT_585965 [Piromyces finnis]|uniref:CBS domain-containing protein n=1 Tax=Piromyces finnis TaxID=1754191 RepID=A0A1Y1V2F3_9FUNG|nr:hypothetical protein BCR36DRAFT_585965 [Piromyces finnis]|eukprot:ORX44850.1 hypothetical protein BCR36DRAFT_585965 [Piromyces finnis]
MAFPIFKEFITTHTIKDLISERGEGSIVDGEENISIQEVYNKFLEYNLRCLPIYRLENGNKTYTGYITLFDLIPADVLKVVEEKYQNGEGDIEKIVDNIEYFKQPIKTILKNINLELKIISQEVTIRELIQILSKFNHYCLIKIDDNKYEIVNQYDLVAYLFNHIEKIDDELLDQTAKDCSGIVIKKRIAKVEGRVPLEYFKDIELPKFVKMSYKQTALEGFKLLLENKVECVAITDDDNTIISVLTSGNIRGLNPEALKEIVKPILPFLKAALDDIPEPRTCNSSYTIIQLIKKLMHYQTRRLVMVNSENEPFGIVSMTDIVNSLNIEEMTKLE